jgi:hypothetical protein
MTVDPSYVEQNRAATERLRAMAARSEADLCRPVGEHWTVSVVLCHITWWDRLALYVLDMTEQQGKLFVPDFGTFVNDLTLPFWLAVPPREAARLAVETAEALDRRLESYPPNLLAEVHDFRPRWVFRSLHRNNHLAEAEAALGG